MQINNNIKKIDNTGNSKFDFSIIIPTWNNLNLLKFCIESIRKNSRLNLQIIVFVNEGKDGTPAWLNEQNDIDFVISTENIGICYALNLARPLVKSDYILYMNDDMYVLPGWDIALFDEIHRIGTKMFMLSATMIEPNDTKNPCVVVKDYGHNPETFNEEKLLGDYTGLFRPDWSGSTWPPNLVHKDLWDSVGGLSIEFSPGMYSDPDFSKKLYEAGIRIFKGIGNSLVYHFGSKTTKRLGKNTGRKQFLMKWGITPKTFTQKYLHLGEKYNELPKDFSLSLIDKAKNKIKLFFIIIF